MEDIERYFDGKPRSFEIFKAIQEQLAARGPAEVSVKSQISFSVNRKFAWFWLYNVTKKDPNGVPHVMLLIDRRIDDPHVRNIEQVGKNRWNHQIVIRTTADAKSDWLEALLAAAYDLGSR